MLIEMIKIFSYHYPNSDPIIQIFLCAPPADQASKPELDVAEKNIADEMSNSLSHSYRFSRAGLLCKRADGDGRHALTTNFQFTGGHA